MSTCGNCKKDSSDNHHSTFYLESWGMFPLCNPCFDKLTPEERLPHYDALLWKWQCFGEPDCHGLSWEEAWEKVTEAVLAGK